VTLRRHLSVVLPFVEIEWNYRATYVGKKLIHITCCRPSLNTLTNVPLRVKTVMIRRKMEVSKVNCTSAQMYSVVA
jgi:hypothetical protein